MSELEDLEKRIVFLEDRAGVVYTAQNAEVGEWVEILSCYRIRCDGSSPEWRDEDGTWKAGTPGSLLEAAYRKGREVALEESQTELDKRARDITALKANLASIGILMQERGAIGDLGGPNYSLIFGAVQIYILKLEAKRDGVRGEQVRELVEAVEDCDRTLLLGCVHQPRWERVLAAAKAVKGGGADADSY